MRGPSGPLGPAGIAGCIYCGLWAGLAKWGANAKCQHRCITIYRIQRRLTAEVRFLT